MTKTGAWATHAAVEARDSVLMPDGITPEEAETVVVNGVTAWQMLYRAAHVQPGQTVLVFGANGGVGGVGGMLIQLAQHHGVTVIGAASPRHHDALRAAGVIPVDYADPDLAAAGPRPGVRAPARRHDHGEHRRPVPPDRGSRRTRAGRIPHPQREGDPAALSSSLGEP